MRKNDHVRQNNDNRYFGAIIFTTQYQSFTLVVRIIRSRRLWFTKSWSWWFKEKFLWSIKWSLATHEII